LWGIWKAVSNKGLKKITIQVLTLFLFCFQNIPEYDVALVKQYGKVFGYFDGMLPNLWITDADMIKAICVKDFEHFVDRRVRLFFCIVQYYYR
jgi:hypothetical protein